MRYAICNETFVDWPLERACAAAAEAGYTGLEVAPFTLGPRPAALADAERARIADTIRASGLECIGLHWLLARTEGLHVTSPDAAARKAAVAHLAALAALCRDLGGRVLVFGSPQQRSLVAGTTPEEALDRLRGVFTELVPALEATGTVVALEPLAPSETDVLNTAAGTRGVIARIGSPHVRLHLDVKAMSSEAHPIPEIIRTSAADLEHFHANDANLRGPGFGSVDFGPIFAALGEVEYRGWVSVEVFDYAPGPERAARESIAYMRGVGAGLAARR